MLHKGIETVIAQGQLVALFGAAKGPVLRHISATSPLPEQHLFGEIFMPPHLHVVFVSRDPEFNAGTLFENLTFGVPASRKESQMERVLHICRELGINKDVISAIQDLKGHDPSFSITQLTLLHLARALISDPEVLCIEKPATMLPLPRAQKVFKVLKQFIRERGIGHPEKEIYARRARTCIFSCSKEEHEQMECAHLVLKVNFDGTLTNE